MPYLNIITNQPLDDANTLLASAVDTIHQATGKSKAYIMVSADHNPHFLFNENNAPAAFLDYRAIGLPDDRNAFSDQLCQCITQALAIPGDRIYISFQDAARCDWGWNHQTF